VLKIVVIVLGIAILAMTGIIIVTAINRMGDSVVVEEPSVPSVASSPAPETISLAPDGETWTSVLLPGAEAEIIESAVENGVLRVVTRGADGTVRIHLIDVRTGRRIGEVSAR